jgi:general secretion pathway protein I
VNRSRGFTLIEVLVALAVVALGMSALLEMLSVSASNVAALRDKTIAEWIAMNKIADTRLTLNAPMTMGSTEGDIDDCAHGSWHWRQDISAVTAIPGLVSISVSVRRTGNAVPTSNRAQRSSPGGLGPPVSLGPSGALGSVSAIGASGCVAAPAPGDTLGSSRPLGVPPSLGPASSSGVNSGLGARTQSSGSLGIVGALGAALTGSNSGGASGGASGSPAGGAAASDSSGGSKTAASASEASWLVTLTGFHGNSLAASQGEQLIWNGKTLPGAPSNNGSNNGLNGSNGGMTLGPTTNPGTAPPGTATPGNPPPLGAPRQNPGLP